ncbi:MAG: UDP-glucose/GDP-mannose dehydrogenase family protein [Candidatus Brocadiae bacterium]|nr:UDP-glucose/GDP-mannose dehydrogenase family protein [Candidatus Brocadiia bacterium]
MKVSVIGTGYVGLVTGTIFAELGHDALCIDSDGRKIDALEAGRIPIYEPGLDALIALNRKAGKLRFGRSIGEAMKHGQVVFICVGTPPLPSGAPDLSAIDAVSREIAKHLTEYRVIVEKSTVPVQTGEKVRVAIAKYAKAGAEFDVVSNPEFLREGSAVQDALNPDRVVVGAESDRARALMLELYEPFRNRTILTDIKSAELIKHASNSFLALKISFINAVANICELSGADVTQVARGMGLDSRIGAAFLNAGIGYGGSCFPKDVDAFVDISSRLGYDFHLLREVQRINQDQRDRFLKKIEAELWVVRGKKIGVWGLSFKPNTDDIRESPAIRICAALRDAGARVSAYDPKGAERAKEVLAGIEFADSAMAAVEGADCLAVCTEWDEFRKADMDKVKAAMAHPTVIDGRNIWDPAEMEKKGFTYRSVGRGAAGGPA